METNSTPSLNSGRFDTVGAYVATVTGPTTFTVPVNITGAGTAGGKALPVDYPMVRQVGQGHDGTKYITDPVYIWNNTGAGADSYSVDMPEDLCGTYADHVSDYIKEGRDYFKSARPGYVKYTYPHPLRTGASSPAPLPATNLRAVPSN